ncbi:sensor domain-containing diguanylate cyclase [Pseudomonas sp. NCCP-436]|uniref:sensor domain-containing diguanylate cyclase n=1 Tax=Pseudomonas sp. NCCP-436 TaxID=2842481 RepID=UPI001C7ED076|nr:sensor domain-containing diguanylate cyclase [Pseudomonas sp. NCCP-436]GIZ12965.1 GGDEF domain-containing protein [Pseudomonas sp. NCCP-436]
MISAEPPSDEPQRQQALDRLELLDTPAAPYLDSLTRLARELFAVKIVLISLIDRDRQWFKSRQGLDVAETPRDISFCAHAVACNDTLVVEDSLVDPRFCDSPLVLEPPHVRFYAGVPLRDEAGLALGTLCLLDPTPRRLTSQELKRLQDMAYLVERYLHLLEQSAQVAHLREALSQAQRKCLLDALTQVWNRAGLRHFLPLEQATAKREGRQLGLIYIDLDHFKQVNDRYGHAGGDQLLWECARRMSTAVRSQDVVTRAGGEEFVILTRVMDARELLHIAERIRQSIASQPIQLENEPIPQTLSLGCALLAPGETPEQALKRADQALYRAKRNGRNRSELAD